MTYKGELRRYLFQQQHGKCHYCRVQMYLPNGKHHGIMKPKACTVDHIHPFKDGGTYSKTNIVGACAKCNNLRGSLNYHHFKTYIEMYGNDLPFKAALRNLTQDVYLSHKRMWDDIRIAHGGPLLMIVSAPPTMQILPSAPIVIRRDFVHLSRRRIQDIVNKTPYYERLEIQREVT